MEEKVMRFTRIIILLVAVLEMIVSIEIYNLIKTIKNISESTYIEIRCKEIKDGKCITK